MANEKLKLTAWENVQQLSAAAWENWLKVTAALIVCIAGIVAVVWPYYSSWTAKKQAEKDTVNTNVQNLTTQVTDLRTRMMAAELNARLSQESAKAQEKRLDDILLNGKVQKIEK